MMKEGGRIAGLFLLCFVVCSTNGEQYNSEECNDLAIYLLYFQLRILHLSLSNHFMFSTPQKEKMQVIAMIHKLSGRL